MEGFLEALVAESQEALGVGDRGEAETADAELTGNTLIVERIIEGIETRALVSLYDHLQRTMQVCYAFSKAAEMDSLAQILLATIGGCHDVGKVCFPDLIDKYPLSPAEIKRYRGHVEESMILIEGLQGKTGDLIRKVVGDHHERPKGDGYPKGKTGEQLSAMTVMFIVLDVFATVVWPAPGSPKAQLHPMMRLKTLISELRKGEQDGEFGRGATELLLKVFKRGAFDDMRIPSGRREFRIGDFPKVEIFN